jgi:hypothetical protein
MEVANVVKPFFELLFKFLLKKDRGTKPTNQYLHLQIYVTKMPTIATVAVPALAYFADSKQIRLFLAVPHHRRKQRHVQRQWL